MKSIYTGICSIIFLLGWISAGGQNTGNSWKAGVAKADITPKEPIWMAGYGFRDHPAEGTLHSIWVKALALEDAAGEKAVLVTADLVGWPKRLSDYIRDEAEKKYGLSRAQIILNSSHTHSGPVLAEALSDIYPLDDREKEKIDKYTERLGEVVIATVGKALEDLGPARVFAENGVARFQVNRRNNPENLLDRQEELQGPVDHSVPVLKVESAGGDLTAIVFGYACHGTTLGIYEWSGDYMGFAQIELEKEHPEAMALFFQGAGADQNPLPRRTVPLARQYGRTLAAAVDRVLEEEMVELTPSLQTAYTEIDLDLETPPDAESLIRYCESAEGYQKRWGERMLEKAKSGEPFPESYPYPLQVWKVGDWPVFALGGELLVSYAIRLKEIFGYHSFVMGYSNDVMSYIPGSRVLREGGYEADGAPAVYGLPSGWAYEIESSILHGMVQVAAAAGIYPEERAMIKK